MQRETKCSGLRNFESLALPVVLLLTGLILLIGDKAGILSLDRIQNLWPLALILVGLSDLFEGSGGEPASGVEPVRSPVSETRRV